jgi:hypothetical protein
MPRISFLNIVNYLENLAEKHIDIKNSYRWNVSEVSGALRSGIELPVMLIDAVETQTKGDNTKTIHVNTTAFTILGKPNTRTGNLDEYEAQNEVLDFCQQICFDLESRILEDATLSKANDGSKNWLYGLVDKNSFHHFKIGPIFSDGLYGYRCEVSLKNLVSTCVDNNKWNDR